MVTFSVLILLNQHLAKAENSPQSAMKLNFLDCEPVDNLRSDCENFLALGTVSKHFNFLAGIIFNDTLNALFESILGSVHATAVCDEMTPYIDVGWTNETDCSYNLHIDPYNIWLNGHTCSQQVPKIETFNVIVNTYLTRAKDLLIWICNKDQPNLLPNLLMIFYNEDSRLTCKENLNKPDETPLVYLHDYLQINNLTNLVTCEEKDKLASIEGLGGSWHGWTIFGAVIFIVLSCMARLIFKTFIQKGRTSPEHRPRDLSFLPELQSSL